MKSGATIFVVLALVGFVLAGVGTLLLREAESPEGGLIALVGYGVITIGLGFLATSKGRSPARGLLGLLPPIGLVFLCVLQDASDKKERTFEQP